MHIIQAVPPELVETLMQSPDVVVKTAPGTQPKWMELNVNQPPFDNKQVRQALNYLIDKELIIDAIYQGRAVPLAGVLSPFNNFADPSLTPYPYDPNKAYDLLAEAGIVDSDGDGKLEWNGAPWAFVVDSLEEHRQLAEAVVAQLQEAGIDASLRLWEYSVVRPLLLAGERTAYLDDWATRPLTQWATWRPSGTASWKAPPMAAATSPATITPGSTSSSRLARLRRMKPGATRSTMRPRRSSTTMRRRSS